MADNNILSKYQRQPKIYIKLPSEGRFYKKNPMENSGSGELPVYSMTAKDEITMRTPDSLMNGESTASVIKSCCPLIDDPWEIPSIDLDAILIAIRIATYGEKMTLDVRVPLPNNENEIISTELDLRPLLDSTYGKTFPTTVEHGDLKFHIKPLSYKDQSSFFQSTYETSRLASLMARNDVNDDQKKEAFVQGFKLLSKTTLDVVLKQVLAIETPEGIEQSPQVIKEFFDNTDKDTFVKVQETLTKAKEMFDIPQQTVRVPHNLIERGAPETVSVPVLFDQSNFFAGK